MWFVRKGDIMKRLKWILLISICVFSMSACSSKEVIPEGKDMTFQTQDPGGTAPETIITPTLTKWSMDAFQGEILEVPDIILKQYNKDSLLYSSSPNFFQKEFDSSEAMLNYIGLDVLKIPAWDLNASMNYVAVYGAENGEFKEVNLETDYVTDNLRMQAFARIYMDEQDTVKEHRIEHGGVTVTMEEYYNQEGKFFLFTTSSVSEYGYCCKDAYLVDDNIFYSLHIAYKPEYEENAQERLKQWAELW